MVENIEIDNDRLQQTNNGFTLQNSIIFFSFHLTTILQNIIQK